LTGVRAEVAQTIIGLGAGLDGLETLSTLQAGIARVIRSPDAPRNASGNDDRRTSKPKNG
jgi:hypothetical protein